MKIKKGDTVKILVGKDSGREGRVVKVISEKRMVVVEGINVFKKHLKGDGKEKQSGIIDIAKPIPTSNVMLICPSCSKPSRVGYKVEKSGKVRVCRKCGKAIDEGGPQKKEEKAEKKTARKSTKSKKTSTKKTTKKGPSKKRTSTSKSKTKKK